MKKVIIIFICIVGLVFLYWAAYPNLAPEWTGFGAYKLEKDSYRAKKLWDWFQLLIIPGFLAVGVWVLNKLQKKAEQELETDRQRQTAMESYFDNMTELLLERELRNKESVEARMIARTRTLAMFKLLDVGRKAQVLQFIYELSLIDKDPIIDLNGANLEGVDLEGASLRGAELRGVHFNKANLTYVNFTEADLRGSSFEGADFSFANLTKANLTQAKLGNTKRKETKLLDTTFTQTAWENSN